LAFRLDSLLSIDVATRNADDVCGDYSIIVRERRAYDANGDCQA
jgi:hypothetical protein